MDHARWWRPVVGSGFALAAGCAVSAPVAKPAAQVGRPATSPLSGIAAPSMAGTILLMGIQFPEPGVIGGHFSGVQFQTRVGDILLTEALRRSWSFAASLRMDSVLRRAGYRVMQGALPTSDARRLEGVRFGLLGRVDSLAVRTAGSTGPHSTAANAVVAWELLDLAAGSPVYGRRTAGQGAQADSLRMAVLEALDRALGGLLADSAFLRALVAPRPMDVEEMMAAPYAPRAEPGSSDTIVLVPDDLNPLPDTSVLLRLAAGVVTLRAGREETAVLLSRDGLALTSYQAVRRAHRLYTKFGTGVERPARVLRLNRNAGVALVQISCPDPCTTVPWTTRARAGRDSVIVIGAPFGANPAYLVGRGVVRERAGASVQGRRFNLEVVAELVGGEAVAGADGEVFALTLARRTQSAINLADAFRALNIRPAAVP